MRRRKLANAVDYLLELYVKITAETEKQQENWVNNLEEEARLTFKKLSWNEMKNT